MQGMKKMRELTRDEIIHLATLANLTLNEAEVEKLRKQLTETVVFVENLSELKTDEVKPTFSATDLKDIFFEDGQPNTRGLKKEEALKNASKKNNDYFVVKRIL